MLIPEKVQKIEPVEGLNAQHPQFIPVFYRTPDSIF
jgi:hypothetical protein